ncbi:hypothetical protein AB0M20_41565, partial [Actinoplanes sp. NPDC051633]|uniref:hypothetical protein n=1 Tax=Actinoplanes sp. NPDC051633 TaxID=3155670 RepID=UPI00341A23FE
MTGPDGPGSTGTSDVPGADYRFDDVVRLAAERLAADGGLPFAASPGFLRSRWAAAESVGRGSRDADGRLTAAVSVRPSSAGAVVGVLGVPAETLDWALAQAADRRPGQVTVETEFLTAELSELFGSRGLRQVFAEDVMRFDLGRPVPEPAWPGGITLSGWDGRRFFGVYEAAFRERPGFPGWSAEEWISGVAEDDDFRPDLSVLATDEQVGDVGFVTTMVDWIDQVGVAPVSRGR